MDAYNDIAKVYAKNNVILPDVKLYLYTVDTNRPFYLSEHDKHLLAHSTSYRPILYAHVTSRLINPDRYITHAPDYLYNKFYIAAQYYAPANTPNSIIIPLH